MSTVPAASHLMAASTRDDTVKNILLSGSSRGVLCNDSSGGGGQ
jgi:hypothetical protein